MFVVAIVLCVATNETSCRCECDDDERIAKMACDCNEYDFGRTASIRCVRHSWHRIDSCRREELATRFDSHQL